MVSIDRWLWVTKDPLCWEKLAEENKLEFCFKQSFKKRDKIIVYRSGNHRDLSYIFEVKNDSEPLYGKYKTVLHNKIYIPNSLKLSEMKKDTDIKKWRSKFIKGFYKIHFTQWNKIMGLISQNNPDLFEKHKPKCCLGPDSNGFPLNYKDSFFNLIEKIRKCKDKDFFNEEATKQLIIIPILQKIGWNTYDVCEVHPEHGVHHSSTRVDYILRDHESRQVCIEAKKVSETDFDFHEKQLLKYCAFKQADTGILTNGLLWRFYRIHYNSKHLGAIRKTDSKEINIFNANNNQILQIFIDYLWRGNISTNERHPIRIPSLDTIFDNIRNITPNDRLKYNEEAMKQGIIIPLLNNLGWNTFDPSEIVFEKSIKVPRRKKHKKIDYILGNDSNQIVLEVKGIASDISDQNVLVNDEGHVLEYMKAGKYNFGILTNGIIWKFYLIKNGLFWGSYKINFQEGNVKKEDMESLISKESILNGNNINYLKKLV